MLRRSDKARILWIDAICIDQANLEEQGRQVRLIWEIYQRAERAVIWLGPEEGESARAMDNIATRTSQANVQDRADSRSVMRVDSKGRTRCGYPVGDFDTIPHAGRRAESTP